MKPQSSNINALSLPFQPNFSLQMHEILNECKSVVFTGHSLGGAIASLSALWLLSFIKSTSLSIDVLCITYGSPMLGNESFSQAILQERWSGNFCHVVTPHDIVPRLLFAPASPLIDQFKALFQFWQLSMASNSYSSASPLPYEIKADIFGIVLACTEERFRGGAGKGISSFWPFGSYVFCAENGAICLDNRKAIMELLYLVLAKGSAESCVEDHLKYGDYVPRFCLKFLQRKSLMDTCFSESSNEAGVALALQSTGMASPEEPIIYGTAKNCLMTARRSGCRRSLNNAKMAVSLAKITPLRAQIEWYKAFCDGSDDLLGYYDSFKQRTASRKGSKVNMNRLRLGQFWDELINMLETNQLTHDFHKLPKYVCASQSYKLLVEPLEIAEYYRNGMHKKKGHYIEHGREKRFKIFDKWWADRKVGDEESNPRSKFASLTQDSCFWARVEEARESIYQITGEMDSGRQSLLLNKIEEFEKYARGMIERKDVSVDVLAKNSSYGMFVEECKLLKSQMQLFTVVPQDGMVQDIVAESTFMSSFHDGKLVS